MGKLDALKIAEEAISARRGANAASSTLDFVLGAGKKVETGPYKGPLRNINFADGSNGWEGTAQNLPAVFKVDPKTEATGSSLFSDLFSGAKGVPGIGGAMLTGAGFAGAGSAIYGGAHLASPNNAEVNDPMKNIFKGALVGGIAGAAMLASHNATVGKQFTKAASQTNANWFLKKGVDIAPGVKNAMNSPVAKGAIAAGLIAGSGQFDLTRPVNPVY